MKKQDKSLKKKRYINCISITECDPEQQRRKNFCTQGQPKPKAGEAVLGLRKIKFLGASNFLRPWSQKMEHKLGLWSPVTTIPELDLSLDCAHFK